MKNLAFPFHFDGRGRTAQAQDHHAHVRQLIEQLLFTSPGERVNQPEFGSGLLQMAFAPNRQELAGALQFTMQAALQRYLGDLIELQELEVTNEEAALQVRINYLVRRTQQQQVAHFRQGGIRS